MTIEKQAELAAAHLIFLAMLKGISEHSTFLIDFYQRAMKMEFNNFIKHADDIIRTQEAKQSDDAKEYLQQVTDVYHNINLEMRVKATEMYLNVLRKEEA